MTRPDIDAIIKRLRGNCVCVLPDACTSQWCRDLGAVETYIRELEEFSDNAWTALLTVRNSAVNLAEGMWEGRERYKWGK